MRKHDNLKSAIALVVLILLALGSVESEEKVEETTYSQRARFYVSAKRLYQDYESNEVAADEKYKGRVIVVSGVVENIGKDIMDTMYISLDTGNFGSVQCMFSERHTSDLTKIQKGDMVRIRGKCDGKLMNVLLRGCILVE